MHTAKKKCVRALALEKNKNNWWMRTEMKTQVLCFRIASTETKKAAQIVMIVWALVRARACQWKASASPNTFELVNLMAIEWNNGPWTLNNRTEQPIRPKSYQVQNDLKTISPNWTVLNWWRRPVKVILLRSMKTKVQTNGHLMWSSWMFAITKFDLSHNSCAELLLSLKPESYRWKWYTNIHWADDLLILPGSIQTSSHLYLLLWLLLIGRWCVSHVERRTFLHGSSFFGWRIFLYESIKTLLSFCSGFKQ